jgi:ATP-dependent Clp protease ATP-binding subunit ClpB
MAQRTSGPVLSRIDDVVLFSPLRFDEIKRIIDLLTADLVERLKVQITIELSEAARADRAWLRPVYGAQPRPSCSASSRRGSGGR